MGTTANDVKRGREVLTFFHNAALRYPENYQMTLGELVYKMSTPPLGNSEFLEGIGFAAAEIPDSVVNSAMQALAEAGEGKIPLNWHSFFDALSGKATETSFFEGVSQVASSTAADIASGVQSAGNTVIETLKSTQGLVVWVPLVLFAGLIFYVYERAK